MAGQILALTEDEKKIKRLALEGTEPDPKDPNPPPKILEEPKKARDAAAPKVVKSEAPAPSSSQAKRKSGNTPKGNSTTVNKKVKTDSPATTPSGDNKAEIIELRRLLCESESDLESARRKVGRLEDQAVDLKTAYKEGKMKMEDTIGDYDDLIELKRATYNHFLSKWESDNSENHGDNITPLIRAFPVTLRKYFLTEIEKDKNALV